MFSTLHHQRCPGWCPSYTFLSIPSFGGILLNFGNLSEFSPVWVIMCLLKGLLCYNSCHVVLFEDPPVIPCPLVQKESLLAWNKNELEKLELEKSRLIDLSKHQLSLWDIIKDCIGEKVFKWKMCLKRWCLSNFNHTGENSFYWVQGMNGSSHNLINRLPKLQHF